MKQRGFSLVEVLVILVVIGILAGIVTGVSANIQKDARDDARRASAAALTEALEKYYQKNGEYPPISHIAATTGLSLSTVKANLNMSNADILVFPLAADKTKASITSGSASTQMMRYEGRGGSCTALACPGFVLSYIEEGTGNTVTINSRWP